MTPKEILLRAAWLIYCNEQRYACIAMKDAVGAYDDGDGWRLNYDSYWEAMHKFEAMYKPAGVGVQDAWFPPPSVEGARQQRVEALRATAATFD